MEEVFFFFFLISYRRIEAKLKDRLKYITWKLYIIQNNNFCPVNFETTKFCMKYKIIAF
jgi:hypothetical protein